MASRPFTKEISWDDYMEHRPAYAPSMWKLWLEYHQGPLSTIHDVGAGGGVAANDLAARVPDVKHIYLSDPGQDHLDFASKMLTQGHPTVNFTFKNAVAEDAWLEDASVDLVCCCEALHWVDVDNGMPVMARSLRPGGTFAAVFYQPYPEIRNSERAQAGQTALLDGWRKGAPDALIQHPAWRRGFSNSNAGLDFVPFDSSLWSDFRRVDINTNGGEWPRSEIIAERFGEAPIRIEEEEGKERWEDEGWKRKGASVETLRQILNKFVNPPEETWKSEAWKEVLEGAKEVGGELDLVFQVAIVLARKR